MVWFKYLSRSLDLSLPQGHVKTKVDLHTVTQVEEKLARLFLLALYSFRLVSRSHVSKDI